MFLVLIPLLLLLLSFAQYFPFEIGRLVVSGFVSGNKARAVLSRIGWHRGDTESLAHQWVREEAFHGPRDLYPLQVGPGLWTPRIPAARALVGFSFHGHRHVQSRWKPFGCFGFSFVAW